MIKTARNAERIKIDSSTKDLYFELDELRTELALQYEGIFTERAKAAMSEAGSFTGKANGKLMTTLSQASDGLFDLDMNWSERAGSDRRCR